MTSVQEVPLKIALVRSGEVVEVRRRRLVNPSYGVVEKVASEVARGKYRLQYTDEDGDVVTMSSQEEWEECLASWDASHPLKLRIELCGPRGLGRRGCRSGSRSRSRSTSSHRRCHRSRSRSVSSNSKHRHWGRRSLSPSRRCTEVPSRHGSPFGRTHSPLRFQARLAKMEAARRMRQVSCSTPPQAEHPFLCRGFPFGAKGMHGHGKGFEGMHSHCGRRMQKCAKPTEAPEKTNDMPSSDERPQAEHPFFLFRDLLGVFAGKGMHGHGKGSKGAHGHGGKGCKGMPEHAGHRHIHHGRRAVNSELIGQKCANCEFQTTGVVDLYCCRACMFGKDHHGKRCQQLSFAEEDEQKTTEETPQSAVASSSEVVEGDEQQVKNVHDEAQEEPKAVVPVEEQSRAEEEFPAESLPPSGEVHTDEAHEATPQRTPTCSEATTVESTDDGWVHAEAGTTEERAAGVGPIKEQSTTVVVLTEQDEEASTVIEEEPTSNLTEEPETVAAEGQPNTAEEESPVQAPFARQIAQLREMGFAVTPQTVDNLAASNGDLATVVAGFLTE